MRARRPLAASTTSAPREISPDATVPALHTLRAAYEAAGAEDALVVVRDPVSGHQETPEMRRAVLAFLSRVLGDGPARRV